MSTRFCDCGCGTRIHPRSYAHQIGDQFYAQKCVRLVLLPDPVPPTPTATENNT